VFLKDGEVQSTNGFLNSLRLKFCDINNTLFSLKAHINILVKDKRWIQNTRQFIKFNEISEDLMSMMSIAEEFYTII